MVDLYPKDGNDNPVSNLIEATKVDILPQKGNTKDVHVIVPDATSNAHVVRAKVEEDDKGIVTIKPSLVYVEKEKEVLEAVENTPNLVIRGNASDPSSS